jgi:uncharacterized protein YrrD
MTFDMSPNSQALVKYSDLLGRLVINRLTAEEVGHVDQVWLDGKTQQALGFTYRAGLLNLKRPLVSWTQLESIGPDSLVVSLPEGAVQDQPPQSGITLIGFELWSEDGLKAGVIGDYHLDPETGAIADYLLIRDEWQGMTSGIYRILPQDVVSIGQHRVIVTRQAVDQAEQVVGAIAQRVSEFFKRDYQRTLDHLSSAFGDPKAIAQRLQTKAQGLAGSFQSKGGESAAEALPPSPSAPESESNGEPVHPPPSPQEPDPPAS